MVMKSVVLIWILLMSAWAFVTMGFDKRQAKKHGQRVPEKQLWTLAFVGGGIGAYLGMQIFKHKTRHTTFRVGFLMLAIAYVFLILYLLGVAVPGVLVA